MDSQDKLVICLDGTDPEFWRKLKELDQFYRRVVELGVQKEIDDGFDRLYKAFKENPEVDPAAILNKKLSDPLPHELMTFTVVLAGSKEDE